MAEWDPMAATVIATVCAALASALGVLPFRKPDAVEPAGIAFAQALASGAMLGIGYLLLFEALALSLVTVVLGGLAGIAYTLGVQTLAGVRELHRETRGAEDAGLGYRALLQGSLHSASEGVAIGVSMAVSAELGLFMAGALALHNVGEAMALTQSLRGNRLNLLQLGGLAVMTKHSQVLLALLTLLLIGRFDRSLPAVLGFASVSLFYLVLTELLPAAYGKASRRGIAAAVSLAAGAVVLLEGVLI